MNPDLLIPIAVAGFVLVVCALWFVRRGARPAVNRTVMRRMSRPDQADEGGITKNDSRRLTGREFLSRFYRLNLLQKLEALREPLERVTVDDPSLMWNVALVSALELANLADQAVVIAHSAVNRTESRGAHAREDYQKRDDVNWLKHTCAWKDEDWNVRFAYRPVHLHALSNEAPSFPPAERTH